jgi:hypothetical protein
MFDLNPMDVLKQRKLSILPPHFAKIKITDGELFEGNVEQWIKSKLKGRFAICGSPSINKEGSLESATFVAFEDHQELTYFMLACPHLRRN